MNENIFEELGAVIADKLKSAVPNLLQSTPRKTKYQIYKFFIANGSTPDVTIDENIDTRYKRVTGVFMYTDEAIANNLNLEFENDLRISDQIVYPANFDSFLLYPVLQNQEFTTLKPAIPVANSKIEGRVKSFTAVGADTYFTILLRVEE